MRTKLFLAALAGVALASCVTDKEYFETNPEQSAKIVFDSPVVYNNDSQTRANYYGEISPETISEKKSYPTSENFQIYAVQHTGDFAGWAANNVKTPAVGFNNTSISYDSSLDAWVPRTAGLGYYFWPGDGEKMSFAACSPADLACAGATRTYGAAGLKIENFEVASDASKQYDLMFSKRAVNQTSANMNHTEGVYSGIPIQFQHALSSVRFSIHNSSSYNVVLKKITVYGANYKGTFNENIKNETATYSRDDKTVVDPAWTVDPARVVEGNAYVAFEGSVAFPENPQYVANIVNAEPQGNVCNMLLLLPQTLTEDLKIHVEYTVDGQKAEKTVKVLDAKPTSKATTASTIESWEMGTRYTYRLHYSAQSADKDKIYFAPSTDGWKDADVHEIELL